MATESRTVSRVPFVLVERAGWRLVYADERSENSGSLRFACASGAATGTGIDVADEGAQARLDWYRVGSRTQDDAHRVNTTAVLGATAAIFDHFGGQRWPRELIAGWESDDRWFEFTATAGMETFKAWLASLRSVDAQTWFSAAPDSVVLPADGEHVVASMLEGVPLPPGFDVSSIRAIGLVKDRYQLGAAVTGTIACTWLKLWSEARQDGNVAAVREATDAMATAKTWPILQEMAKDGDWPYFVEAFAEAMPSGLWHGQPLEGDVNSGLGCRALGVPVPEP
jgi:hypothetical protein